MTRTRISVIGPGGDDVIPRSHLETAREVGRLLARKNVQLMCGGLLGIMRAACEGAFTSGGTTVGFLPGILDDGNEFLSVMVPTGLGELRNGLVVQSGHATICIGGSWGTLSEVALTLRTGRTCVAIESWGITGIDGGQLVGDDRLIQATTAREAVELAVHAAERWKSG